MFLSNRVCLNLCLHLNSFCLCARPHVHDATLGGEYIPVQSEASLQLCSLLFFSLYPLIPSLVPLKWQFVKHGPLLAFSFASQPFPARLLTSLPSVVPLHHTLLSTSLVLQPSLSFISIPPVHPRQSLHLCPSVILSYSSIQVSVIVIPLIATSVFLFPVRYFCCTLSHPSAFPLCFATGFHKHAVINCFFSSPTSPCTQY